MTGTEKQIAYATSVLEETIDHFPASMQEAVRIWADGKHAGFILDHQAGLVDLCKAAAYIIKLPEALAKCPVEQRPAFFAQLDKQVARAKYDPELWARYEALKNA